MPVTGQKIVAKNIIAYGGGFLKKFDKTMTEVATILDRQITKNMSRKDYTLKELAAMDHPFAKRHGSKGRPIYDPYWMVHTRSGRLLKAKKKGTTKAKFNGTTLIASAYVSINPGEAPHALYVIFGTSRMIPRPVLEGSKDQVVDDAVRHIRITMYGMTTNFKGRQI
jgi:hypothetical protein